jgi:hypothetical protein
MQQLNETEQWLIEQTRANLLAKNTAQNPSAEEMGRYTKSFWPFLDPYFSSLNPVFSFEAGPSLFQSGQKTILLRDGAIPLAWFFEGASRELAAAAQIFVHSTLGALVPERWKNRTKFYNIYSEQEFHEGNPPETLFLYGPICRGVMSLEELEEKLEQVQRILGKAEPKRVLLFSPIRRTEFFGVEDESFEFQYYHRIFRRFGSKVEFISWQGAERMPHTHTALVELNHGWTYQDSTAAHILLRKGAGLLRLPSNEKTGTRVPLSPNHGMEISPMPAKTGFYSTEGKEDLLRFYSMLHQRANDPLIRVPWPKWFQGYFRAAQKSQ